MYVVSKLLRPALLGTRVGFMCTRRCLASWDTNSALLCYGYYASPCYVFHHQRALLRAVVQDRLHTYECSVGIYVLDASTGLLRTCAYVGRHAFHYDYIEYLPINGVA